MADSVSADPRIGSEIAGYRIERLLGRGGMGVATRHGTWRSTRRTCSVVDGVLVLVA